MANFKIFNIGKANAEITSADAVIDPALEKAGIKTIPVGDRTVPAAEAPLADKIQAYLSVVSPPDGQQNLADMIVTNDTLAKSCEQMKADLVTARATVEALQRDKASLESQLESNTAALDQATQKVGQRDVELKSAADTISRMTAEAKSVNAELSKLCVAAGCLTLRDANGEEFAPTVSQAEKQAAAEAVPMQDKLRAYSGAVNSAIAKIGVDPKRSPIAGQAQGDLVVQLNNIEDPVERQKFIKANYSALYRASRR